jgi:uncharacterized membrane protein YhaH (DUF805 family)
MDLQKLFLNGDGRIARQDFWIGIVILIVANIVLGFVAGLVGWAVAGIWGAAILAGLVGLAMTLPAYFLMVKRSNDRDYPQTYVQALMALNIAFQIKNMIMPIASRPLTAARSACCNACSTRPDSRRIACLLASRHAGRRQSLRPLRLGRALSALRRPYRRGAARAMTKWSRDPFSPPRSPTAWSGGAAPST